MNVQSCRSLSDAAPLHLPLGLFLKPAARVRISAALGTGARAGRSVSGWEATEKLRELIRPDSFSSLRVVSSGPEELVFEGELDDRKRLRSALKALDGRTLVLDGFREPLAVVAAEAKGDFPSRHDWDSFFRDAVDMDEMKPGERPDTVHLKNLPIEWFADRSAPKSDPRPSESLFRKAFERFGKVRRVDVPVCDPHRKQMKDHMTGISKFSFDSDLHFEGYVQFVEYAGFVRAMDALRGAKLARKEDDGTGRAVAIQVDFDRTKHLSDASIKRRSIVRERLVARQKAREEKEKEELSKKKKKEEAERREKDRSEREKLTHTQEREQRRKAKQLAKLKEKEASEINSKIAREQKKLLRTQRKLQSIRLLEELFERLQVKHKSGIALKEQDATDVRDCNRENKKELRKLEKALLYESKEKLSRDKLVSKYKNAQEQELEDQRMKLQKALEGKIVLRSVLDTGKRKIRSSSSISSLSSGSDIPEYIEKDIKLEKHLTPDKDLFIKKEPNEAMTSSYHAQLSHYNYSSYAPYLNQNYNYHQPLASGYYPRPGYFPAQEHGYPSRGRGYSRRPRGNHYGLRGYRSIPRIPYFDGSDSTQAYYKYFKNLTDGTSGDYDNRNRSYSRSRSRSRRRSYSRSRSRSSRSRSRSRSRRHSSSRRRSRYSRSRSYDSRSRSRSRNRRSKTRSRNRRSRSRSRSNHSKRSHRTRSKSNNRSHSRSRNKSKSGSKSRLKSRSKSQSKAKSKSKSRSLSKHSTESKSKYKRLNSDTKQPTDFIPRSVRENSKKETSQNDAHKSGDDKSTSEVRNTKESEDSNRKNRSNNWSPVAD